jgi:hypothetical protein
MVFFSNARTHALPARSSLMKCFIRITTVVLILGLVIEPQVISAFSWRIPAQQPGVVFSQQALIARLAGAYRQRDGQAAIRVARWGFQEQLADGMLDYQRPDKSKKFHDFDWHLYKPRFSWKDWRAWFFSENRNADGGGDGFRSHEEILLARLQDQADAVKSLWFWVDREFGVMLFRLLSAGAAHGIQEDIDLSNLGFVGIPGKTRRPLASYMSAEDWQSVIGNLVINALHAMRESSVRQLSIQTGHEDGFDVIRISDTGHGIPSEKIHLMWGDLSGKPGEQKGIGAGLNKVKAILAGYNSSIKVKSEPGKGTTFIIRFPVNKPAGDPGWDPVIAPAIDRATLSVEGIIVEVEKKFQASRSDSVPAQVTLEMPGLKRMRRGYRKSMSVTVTLMRPLSETALMLASDVTVVVRGMRSSNPSLRRLATRIRHLKVSMRISPGAASRANPSSEGRRARAPWDRTYATLSEKPQDDVQPHLVAEHIVDLVSHASIASSIHAYREVLSLLKAIGVLPEPGQGDLVSVMGGTDLIPFEKISGVILNHSMGDEFDMINEFKKALSQHGVNVAPRYFKGLIEIEFNRPFEAVQRLMRRLDIVPRVFLFKDAETFFRLYAPMARGQGFLPGDVNAHYMQALSTFVASAVADGVPIIVMEKEDIVTSQTLESLGYQDILPSLVSPEIYGNMQKFQKAVTAIAIKSTDLSLGRKIRVFSKPGFDNPRSLRRAG